MQKMVQGTTCGVGEPQWEVQGTDASASANCIMCRAQAQACIALPTQTRVHPRGEGVYHFRGQERRGARIGEPRGAENGAGHHARNWRAAVGSARHRRVRKCELPLCRAQAQRHHMRDKRRNARIGEPRCAYGWMQSARSRCRVRCRAPTVRKCDGVQEMPGTNAGSRHNSRIGAPRCADKRAAMCREGARRATV